MLSGYGEDDIVPCLALDSEDIFGLPYTFNFVFKEVKKPDPEKPINPYYNFYKLLMRSSDWMERVRDSHRLPHSVVFLDV
jgi:hypothetical protein